VWFRKFPALNLAPLVRLPHLQELFLLDIDEPVDVSSFVRLSHRLRVHLRDTATVGNSGPLVKIRKL
jgi:hypothetical protein